MVQRYQKDRTLQHNNRIISKNVKKCENPVFKGKTLIYLMYCIDDTSKGLSAVIPLKIASRAKAKPAGFFSPFKVLRNCKAPW